MKIIIDAASFFSQIALLFFVAWGFILLVHAFSG